MKTRNIHHSGNYRIYAYPSPTNDVSPPEAYDWYYYERTVDCLRSARSRIAELNKRGQRAFFTVDRTMPGAFY